jgi:hypothetical protein
LRGNPDRPLPCDLIYRNAFRPDWRYSDDFTIRRAQQVLSILVLGAVSGQQTDGGYSGGLGGTLIGMVAGDPQLCCKSSFPLNWQRRRRKPLGGLIIVKFQQAGLGDSSMSSWIGGGYAAQSWREMTSRWAKIYIEQRRVRSWADRPKELAQPGQKLIRSCCA